MLRLFVAVEAACVAGGDGGMFEGPAGCSEDMSLL